METEGAAGVDLTTPIHKKYITKNYLTITNTKWLRSPVQAPALEPQPIFGPRRTLLILINYMHRIEPSDDRRPKYKEFFGILIILIFLGHFSLLYPKFCPFVIYVIYIT